MVTRSRLSRAGKGAKKTSRLKRTVPKYIEKFKGQTITTGSHHDWSVTEDGHNDLRLGNSTTEGWIWNGGDEDMVGFLVRIGESKITQEFLNDVEGKVDFNDVKPILKENIKKNDGLYELSGDNVIWHFGEWEIDSDAEKQELIENDGLSEKNAEAVIDKSWSYYSPDFDDFEKQYGEEYREGMMSKLENSNSFQGFIENVDGFKQEMTESMASYHDGKFSEAVAEAIKQLKV